MNRDGRCRKSTLSVRTVCRSDYTVEERGFEYAAGEEPITVKPRHIVDSCNVVQIRHFD